MGNSQSAEDEQRQPAPTSSSSSVSSSSHSGQSRTSSSKTPKSVDKFFDATNRYGKKLDNAIGRVVAATVGSSAQKRVRALFLPMNKEKYTEASMSRVRAILLNRLRGKTVRLKTRDDIELDAVWCSPPGRDFHHLVDGDEEFNVSSNESAAIIFHGNGCTLDSMSEFAQFYLHHRMNVLLVTIRGYPGSGGDAVHAGEIGLYLDSVAAYDYVTKTQQISKNKVLFHGYSLGGSLAAAGGLYFGAHVTLDHTFTSLREVAHDFAKKQISSHLPKYVSYPVSLSLFL